MRALLALALLLAPVGAQHGASPAARAVAEVPHGEVVLLRGGGDSAARRLKVLGEGSFDHLSEIQKKAKLVVGALVKSFLAEQGLTKEDQRCLVHGSKEFAGKIMMVTTHIVMLVQQLMGKRDDVPGLAKPEDLLSGFNFTFQAAAPAPAPAPTPAPTTLPPTTSAPNVEEQSMDAFFGGRRLDQLEDSGQLLMHLSQVLMEAGLSLQLLVKLSNQITTECINGEAREALEAAGRHARDVKYVGGHFLANGADIVKELADAVIAYKHQDFPRFGTDVGTALRKIFLSNETDARLPSGKPGKYMMVNMSMGFVKGFFGRGFTLGIRLKENPDEPLRIDLEECIANNLPFFTEIGTTVAFAMARKEKMRHSDGDDSEEGSHQSDGKAELGTALAVAALQLPDALKRCDIGRDQADMLMDSIRSFGNGMSLTLSTPNTVGSEKDIAKELGRTIKDWGALDWYQFGYDLGHLMQNLVLSLFQKKYSVDGDDVLRRQLTRLDGEGGQRFQRAGVTSNVVLALPIFAAFAAAAMTAWRARRRLHRIGGSAASQPASEMEVAADDYAYEPAAGLLLDEECVE